MTRFVKLRICPTQWGGGASKRVRALHVSPALHDAVAAVAQAEGCTLRDAFEAAITRALDAAAETRPL